MRLLSIASSSVKGGATISLINTLAGLKNKGVDISVAVPDKGYLTEKLEDLNIEYCLTPAPFWAWPNISNIEDFFKFFPRLLKICLKEVSGYNNLKSIIKKNRPDIIHTNVSVIDIGYRIAKKFKIPHVWHIREYGDKDFNIHSIYGKIKHRKKLADSYTICITHDLKGYFELGESSRVIYNGIEEKDIGYSSKENKILYVGRLTEEKGVTDIINTFCDFCEGNVEYSLDLIGSYDPEYGGFLKQLVRSNNLQDRISFIGSVDDVYSRMQKAKAIIVASKCEGFGRITAEAMLNNCLVIGKNTGGTKEQFDNGLFLCNREIGIRYEDPIGFLLALEKLTNLSDEEYNDITMCANMTVKQLYSVTQNVDNIYNFLSYILHNYSKKNSS